ncbi:cyclodeaminase/cyclohydrolase family protein [Paraburkholderia sp. GAS82]|uniref:cyclodeaminase/cyclohydrolase family protein n=1 Tax=Paraburkholderia sp. GAS82 TaxID=3035137 RepID=UPI003D1EE32E
MTPNGSGAPEGELLTRPANQLLDDFGAGKASPGSGSAAALMGLLAAKLIRTVCRKSLEKEECRPVERLLQHIHGQMDAIEPKLRLLFEKDAKEFDEVVRLRIARNAATTPEAKSAFSRQSNDLLEVATDNAFQTVELCMTLIDHGVAVFENGWPLVRGDSGAAISAAMAAVMSGIFIANLNLKSLRARNYARDHIDRCADLYAELQRKQETAFRCVTSLNAEALASLQLDLPLPVTDSASADVLSETNTPKTLLSDTPP